MLKKFVSLLAAAALFVPSANALDTPPGDCLYVIGDITGWDIERTEYTLPKVSDNVYRGIVNINNGNSTLRFYTALGDWEKNSIGFKVDDEPTDIEMSAEEYTGSFVEGKGSWNICDTFGWVELTVNFTNSSVTFAHVYIDGLYLVSPDIPGAEEAPNAVDPANIAYDGDFRFRYEAVMTTGNTYSLGSAKYYLADSAGIDPNVEMEPESDCSTYRIIPSDTYFTVKGCTTDNSVAISTDPEALTVEIKRSSFNPEDMTFSLKEDYPRTIAIGYGIYISAVLDLDPDLDLSKLHIESSDGAEVDFNSSNGFFGCRQEGHHTFRVYTDEIPGKVVEFDITWLPFRPDKYYIYTTGNENTGLSLQPTGSGRNLYTSLITIPEGEGDFLFYFDGTGEGQGWYIVANVNPESVFDLDAELSSLGCSYIGASGGGYWFTIPERFRGKKYIFRLDIFNMNIEICQEGYEFPIVFEWNNTEDLTLRAGYNVTELSREINHNPEIDQDDIIVTFYPADLENCEAGQNGYFAPYREYSGPATVIATATTSELQEKGISISKTIHVLPWMPESWLIVSDGTAVDGAALTPKEGSPNIFEGTLTIHEGEGDFLFHLTDNEMREAFYRYGDGSATFDLSSGMAFATVNEWSTDDMRIPAEYRGNTYNIRLNCNNNALQIFMDGADPEMITVTPDSSNPNYVAANRYSNFRFFVSGVDPYRCEFRIEGTDNVTINFANPIGTGNDSGVCYEVNMYCTYLTSDENFRLIAGKNTGDGFKQYFEQEMQARFVEIESIEAAQHVVLREGEFVTIDVTPYPEINSMSIREEYDSEAFTMISTGNKRYILAAKAGTTAISWVATDWNGHDNALSTTEVTVLPKEASVGEHIFHAQMDIDARLPLKLSAHSTRDYAETTWTSSNPEIASVDQDGVVTALKNGVALITADCGTHQTFMGIIVNDGNHSGEESTALSRVCAYGRDGVIYVAGAAEGTDIRVFDEAGATRAASKSTGSHDSFPVGRGIFIVTTGTEVFKIAL